MATFYRTYSKTPSKKWSILLASTTHRDDMEETEVDISQPIPVDQVRHEETRHDTNETKRGDEYRSRLKAHEYKNKHQTSDGQLCIGYSLDERVMLVH